MITEIFRFRALLPDMRADRFDPRYRYGRDHLEEVRRILTARGYKSDTA